MVGAAEWVARVLVGHSEEFGERRFSPAQFFSRQPNRGWNDFRLLDHDLNGSAFRELCLVNNYTVTDFPVKRHGIDSPQTILSSGQTSAGWLGFAKRNPAH